MLSELVIKKSRSDSQRSLIKECAKTFFGEFHTHNRQSGKRRMKNAFSTLEIDYDVTSSVSVP